MARKSRTRLSRVPVSKPLQQDATFSIFIHAPWSDRRRRSPILSSSRFYPNCDPTDTPPVNYIRSTLNPSKLAVTGYCFGGRYSFRFVDAARTIKADVAFAAHPSAWVDGEVSAIGAATAVATAGKLPPPPKPQFILRQGPRVATDWLFEVPLAMTRANCVALYVEEYIIWAMTKHGKLTRFCHRPGQSPAGVLEGRTRGSAAQHQLALSS